MSCLTDGPAASSETVGGAAEGASGLLPLQPIEPTRDGSPWRCKGCRTVTLGILYSPASWRSSETWNWVPALPIVSDTSGGRCSVTYRDHWYKFPGVAQCTGAEKCGAPGRAGPVSWGGLLRAFKMGEGGGVLGRRLAQLQCKKLTRWEGAGYFGPLCKFLPLDSRHRLWCLLEWWLFLEVGRFKVLELERIYQNRTGRNRLSLWVAWPMVLQQEVRQSVEQPRVPAVFCPPHSSESRRITATHSDNLLRPVRYW